MSRILVVDNYDSFVYTIVGYLEQLGAETTVVRNDAVPEGTEVDLLTGSNGDGEAVMPNVVGRRLEQAQDQLAELGFRRIQVRRESTSNDAEDGRVTDQSIQPGERVSTDQTITLTVAEAGGGLVN